MITVTPGQSFTFNDPNREWNLEQIVSGIKAVLSVANPFVDTLEILNKTKSCTIDIAFSEKKITVIFRNPKDEEFDLNELDHKPLTITGR